MVADWRGLLLLGSQRRNEWHYSSIGRICTGAPASLFTLVTAPRGPATDRSIPSSSASSSVADHLRESHDSSPRCASIAVWRTRTKIARCSWLAANKLPVGVVTGRKSSPGLFSTSGIPKTEGASLARKASMLLSRSTLSRWPFASSTMSACCSRRTLTCVLRWST